MRALDSKSSIHSAVDLHRFQTKAESIRRNDASNLAGIQIRPQPIGLPTILGHLDCVTFGKNETSQALYRKSVSKGLIFPVN